MSEFVTGLTNDVVFKYVFGSKGSEEPLRALLNALLERGPHDRIQQVQIVNPGLGRDQLDDKAVVLDVRARDEKRGSYNIEMQVASERHFEKRATYYLTKVHAEQIGKGEEYDLIAPSISIWLFDHVRFRERPELHSLYLLREREHGDVLTDDLQIHFIELPKFGKRDVSELSTPVDKWLHVLRFAQEYARGGEPLPEKLRTEDGVAMAFDKMQQAQSDEEVRCWIDSREKFRRDVASRVSDAREEGREEGHREARRETARRLLDDGYPVSVVARATDLTEAEVEALRLQE